MIEQERADNECRHDGADIFYCVTHSSYWSRDEACDQVYIDAERDEDDRVLQQAKDERAEPDPDWPHGDYR